ncbi:MAG: hypothetical protein WED04_07455 [Promethearchaeati archaeon SRVP18_Atabeyarchaeia-1]
MKHFIVIIDILGFEKGAEKEAEILMRPAEYVRDAWTHLIEGRLRNLCDNGTLMKYEPFQLDQWLLVFSDLWKVFVGIGELLVLNLQLEIAIVVEELPELVGSRFFPLTNELVAGLKNKKNAVIGYYHAWYRSTHGNDNEGPRATFVVLTESAYNELDPLDRRRCQRIKREGQKGETIDFFIAEISEILRRGRVFQFLQRIGIPGSAWYDRIDDLYVPPLEYEEIKEVLKRNGILFLSGTKEYGKTYTAIRLLWEYFSKGYEPIWIPGREEREREEVRTRLEEIARELRPHRIIYFEDPFGQTQYERRENLERVIGTITVEIRNVKDAYVIITSREEAFKQFRREQVSSLEFEQFEKKLSIRKPSYNYEKRREILLKWAEAKGCKWLKDDRLKDLILENLNKERILPTPLSIREFVTSTVNVEREEELKKEIMRKSEETERSFAREIGDMSDDKILFLSFAFVSHLPVGLVRREYVRLVHDLRIRNWQTFDEVLNWFKNDKIHIKDGTVMFSHPSYGEAMTHLLVNRGQFTRINKEIVSKVVLRLSEKDEAAVHIIFFVMSYLKQLPENVISESLLRLSKRKGIAFVLAPFLTSRYRLIPSRVKVLLFKLAARRDEAGFVALAVAANYDKLPKRARNLLFKIAETKETARRVVPAVAAYYDRLPTQVRRLLFKSSETCEGAIQLVSGINYNFDKFPENDRKALLLKLLEKDESIREMASVPIITHFDKFTEADGNLLLDKLLEKDETAKDVVTSLVYDTFMFPVLPAKNRKSLLLKLAERTETVVHLALRVEMAFDILPRDIREELLVKLATRWETKPFVTSILTINFDSFSQTVMDQLLLGLMEKDQSGWVASSVLAACYDKLSQTQREFFLRLSQGNKTVLGVALAIAQNFGRLPENVKNTLDSLQPSLQFILESLSGNAETSTRLMAIELISNTLSKIDRDFARIILNRLALDTDQEIRRKASLLLSSIQSKE